MVEEDSVVIVENLKDFSKRDKRHQNTATRRAAAKANKTVQSPLKSFQTPLENTRTQSGAILEPTRAVYANEFSATSLAGSTVNNSVPSATAIPPLKASRPVTPESSRRVFIGTGVVVGLAIFFLIGVAFFRKNFKRRRIFRVSASSWIGDYNTDDGTIKAVAPETQEKFGHLDQEEPLQNQSKSNEAKIRHPDTAKSTNNKQGGSLEDIESVLDPSLEESGPLAQEQKSTARTDRSEKSESDVSVTIPSLQYPASIFHPSSTEFFQTPSSKIYDNSYLYSSILLPFEKESEFNLLLFSDELKKVGLQPPKTHSTNSAQDYEITIPITDEPAHKTPSQQKQSSNREKYIYSNSDASICL